MLHNPIKLIQSLHHCLHQIFEDTTQQVKNLQAEDGFSLIKNAVKKATWELLQPFDPLEQLEVIEHAN